MQDHKSREEFGLQQRYMFKTSKSAAEGNQLIFIRTDIDQRYYLGSNLHSDLQTHNLITKDKVFSFLALALLKSKEKENRSFAVEIAI